MIKYVWETNIFNFSRKDVLICHLVVTNPSKNTLHIHSVLNYFNFTFLYIVESIFSSVWEMKREQFCHQTIFFHFARKWISFHDKEHLLLHWASFHTRKYSCYHDRGILILTTISIVVPNHFWSFFSIFSSLYYHHMNICASTHFLQIAPCTISETTSPEKLSSSQHNCHHSMC